MAKEKNNGRVNAKMRLLRLAEGYPCITPAEGRRLAEAGAVCMETSGHEQGRLLSIVGDFETVHSLHWPRVHDQMRRSLADLQEATERGAVGIAILLVDMLTEFYVVIKAMKGTGVDYWLSEKEDDDLSLSARLEVSGILKGGEKERRKRVREKVK